jgi:uncharacterized protein (TIGR00661 family)
MARCVFIVQGEGRGHLSQAIALREILEEGGHSVEAVFAGCRSPEILPDYFREAFPGKVDCFHSPYFLRTPNNKGIYVGRTILFNLIRTLIYMKEIRRLRKEISKAQPDLVFNFYDVVGAFSLEKIAPGIRRIGIGHHFFLHLEGYRSREGNRWHRWLLRFHTHMVMRSCDRILALSYRDHPGSGKVEVIPPLIRKSFREIRYRPGERYLVYLLHGGFVYDLVLLSREDPDFKADVFTDLSIEPVLPPGVHLHTPCGDSFREKLATCRGLITSAGFDTVAEAAYLGIPLCVVPVRNHFEQRCNGLDVERSGIGLYSEHISPEVLNKLHIFDNRRYREWVDRAPGMIMNCVEK